MVDQGTSIFDLVPALEPGRDKPQANPKGTKVTSLVKPTPEAQPTPFSGFVDRTQQAVKNAATAIADDPSASIEGGAMALFKGGVSMINLSMSGVAALAKTMFQPIKIDPNLSPTEQARQNFEQTNANFNANQAKIHAALEGVDKAPTASKQEEAMTNLLNILPDGTAALGDTVFDKTGSALAATGALSLATLLTLSPEVAGKVMRGVTGDSTLYVRQKGISHRGEMTPEQEAAGNISGRRPSAEEGRTSTQAKTKSLRLSAAFDQLAALHPAAAGALTGHVEQVDANTAKYMKSRIEKFKDASDKDLELIGKRAAAAAIKDLEGSWSEVIKGAHRLPEMKEEGPARQKYPKTDPKLTPEQRAAVRVSTAEARDRESGTSPTDAYIPERMSKRTAEHTAEAERRKASEPVPPAFTPEQVSATIRTAAKEGTEAIVEASKVEQFPKQTVPGSTKDFVSAVEGGPATSKMKDQLSDPKKLQSYISKNAGVAEAWSMDYMKANWKTEITQNPGYSYPFRVETPWGSQSFKTRFEANKYAKNEQALVDARLKQVAEQRKAKGIPDNKSETEWNLDEPDPKLQKRGTAVARAEALLKELDTPEGRAKYNLSPDVTAKVELARARVRKLKGDFDKLIATPRGTPGRMEKLRKLRDDIGRATDLITEAKKGDDPNTPLYISSGIPITRARVEAAFRFTNQLADHIPGVKIAKAKMASLYDGYIETFNPEAKGAPARTAGAAIAQNFFERAHKEHMVWEQGKERRTYWLKMGEAASMDFIHDFEKGVPFKNPIMEKARLAYKNWAEDIYKQDMATGFTYDPVDHYMPHLFKDGDGVLRFMQKAYGNRWADPKFIKERGYDLYQKAIDAGFTPKFTNPEEIMQARQMASDVARLRTDLLADLERKGVARKAAKGADRPPPGYSPNSRRSPTGIRYWVKEEADALMHNAFDSKSLWEGGGSALRRGTSATFRGYMELKNKIIPIKLGASLFHPMHVLHIDASAELTRASKRLLGDPSLSSAKDFMLSAATAYLKPVGSMVKSVGASTKWTNAALGNPMLRVFQGKMDFSLLSDADKASYKDLAEGGLVPTRPREETSGSVQKLKDAWAKKSASTVWHLPWAILSAASHPLFGEWIPTLKIGSYLKDAKVWRELNAEHTPMQRQEAFRQIARKVEARYGEMNYNSLFMDKMAKDIGVATNLSLGWNIGLLDQYVGGAIDLGKATKRIGLDILDPESKGSAFKEELAKGTLDRPIFMSYYVGTALLIGGTMHYMFTGKQPEQLIDYTHPQSGELDQYGKPIRLNTMFYTREFEGLAKHIQQQGAQQGISDFVANKGSGLIEMGRAAITGIDGLGNEIRNENHPAYKQLEETLAFELADINAISMQTLNLSPDANRAKMRGLSVLGFTPAGKYISETVTEGKIANDYFKYVKPKEKPYEAVQMSKQITTLRQLYTNDPDGKYEDTLAATAKRFDMDDKDIHKMEKMFRSPKEAEFDPSVFQFSHLPWEAQKPLLDKMEPEEQEKYLKHVSKQKQKKYKRETEEAE